MMLTCKFNERWVTTSFVYGNDWFCCSLYASLSSRPSGNFHTFSKSLVHVFLPFRPLKRLFNASYHARQRQLLGKSREERNTIKEEQNATPKTRSIEISLTHYEPSRINRDGINYLESSKKRECSSMSWSIETCVTNF